MTTLPTIYPPALTKGDCIGVMSTSCWVEENDILKAKSFIETQGYKVFIHPQTTARLNQSAGSTEEKTQALHDLFADSSIKAIVGARGGNRASTMLDQIDFDLIKQNPKILIGYSDITALLNSIYQKTGLVTFHGPLFKELPTRPDFNQMVGVISGKINSLDLTSGTALKAGNAEGTLLGGNLSVFQGLIGTPYMPSADGAILILEDAGDEISRYDRMLCHLKNADILNKISGLIVGKFTNTKDGKNNPFGFSLKDIVLEHTQGLDIPVIMNAPFGHGDNLCTLPIGAKCTLKNDELSFKSL